MSYRLYQQAHHISTTTSPEMSTTKAPNITLYTDATPNGLKISIALEELSLPYTTHHLDISTSVQKQPWFLAINPNGRIPALTDTFSDGQQINLFESGGILVYLIDEYDQGTHKISFPRGTREYYEMMNWVFFQNAGLGPMQGQAHHFVRYAPEKIEYGIKRYVNETRRLYGVLDTHLGSSSSSGFIVGDHVSIADITTIGWVLWAAWAGVDMDEFPALKRWEGMMMAREAVKRGCDVPKKLDIKARTRDEKTMEEYAQRSRQWIQQGMKDDAERN